jgi:hypothetical protein
LVGANIIDESKYQNKCQTQKPAQPFSNTTFDNGLDT